MAGLTAEAGKVYYFRAGPFPGEADFVLDLDMLNRGQGQVSRGLVAVTVCYTPNLSGMPGAGLFRK